MQSKSYSAQSICVEEKSFRKDGRWEFEDGSFSRLQTFIFHLQTIKFMTFSQPQKLKTIAELINAKFIGDEDIAMLKVSFFGPFYSGYNVIAIDENYKYALVAGKSTKYLWILSRETSIPDSIKRDYLRIAKNSGYTVNDLIWIKHDK